MDANSLTREQLEERLAALHRASLEMIQDISLESLLERIANLACEQVQARYAAVGVLNSDGKLEKFIPIGISREEIAQMAHPPQGLGLIGVLMSSHEPMRITNITQDARSVGFPAHHPPMTSFLGVPIHLGSRQLGQIYLTDKMEGDQFTLDDERVIETLASYAAIAISNASLYRQLIERDRILTRRNENLALLNNLATTLTVSPDLEPVLEQALTQVMDYLNLEVGEVFLRREDNKTLQHVLHQGNAIPELFSKEEFQLGEGAVGFTAQTAQPLQIDLVPLDGQLMGEKARFISQATLSSGFYQIACFPLMGRSGVTGVLCMASRYYISWDEPEMQFLATIGSWVGTAIENVRLNLQQRRLAVLEERERIGMDLHDGIIQDIYAVGLTLEHGRLLLNENPQSARQSIEQAISDLNHTIRDIRAYILDLRPRKLHEENLIEGLGRLVNEFRANTLVEVNLQGPPVGMLKLTNTQAMALFHICQEALANIAKHARCKQVQVTLWTAADRVLLEISDNGRGFDSNKVKLTLGHGLSNIRTRAQNAGGDAEISSEPGVGTTVLAWVPLTPAA